MADKTVVTHIKLIPQGEGLVRISQDESKYGKGLFSVVALRRGQVIGYMDEWYPIMNDLSMDGSLLKRDPHAALRDYVDESKASGAINVCAVPHEGRMLAVVSRDVVAGQELSHYYGPLYWLRHVDPFVDVAIVAKFQHDSAKRGRLDIPFVEHGHIFLPVLRNTLVWAEL